MDKMRHHTISFVHAAQGLKHALSTQPNFLIHLSISIVVVAAGVWLHISYLEWAVVIITIGIGLAIELINTSIEAAIDLVTTQIHPLAKIAKDCASAAMLVYACAAALIGLLIFVPKIAWLFF